MDFLPRLELWDFDSARGREPMVHDSRPLAQLGLAAFCTNIP